MNIPTARATSTTWFPILIVSAIAFIAAGVRAEDAPVDRTVLPLAEPSYPPITEIDARKATPPPRFEVKPPDGAPNVLVILLDNLGYGATKTFGGVIEMPTLERLAKNGLIYNNFHTAPVCSPSRMALLTGRNAHSVNMGASRRSLPRFRDKPPSVP